MDPITQRQRIRFGQPEIGLMHERRRLHAMLPWPQLTRGEPMQITVNLCKQALGRGVVAVAGERYQFGHLAHYAISPSYNARV